MKRQHAMVAVLLWLALLLMFGLALPSLGQASGGLSGNYFDDMNLGHRKLVRLDPVIDFDWGLGSPDPSIPRNGFSVRWRGFIVSRYSERYTFITTSVDGIRVWIKGRLVIDNWTDHPLSRNQGQIRLRTGKRYPIQVEYYNRKGKAIVSLAWKSKHQANEIVPSSQLIPPRQSTETPTPQPSTESATSTPNGTGVPTTQLTNTPTATATPTAGFGWTFCAPDTGTCSLSGTKTVRFGASGVYYYLTAANSVLCSSAVFGDPLPGFVKHCDYEDVPSPVRSFGLDMGGNINYQASGFGLAQNSGSSWVRSALAWSALEPSAGTFDFTWSDFAINSLTQAGLAPVVFVYENPAWVSNIPCGPINTNDPNMLNALSTLMSTLAARYPQVPIWSIYNEPDNSSYASIGYSSGGCFGDDTTNDLNGNGVSDRIDYARMLAAAWQGVHAGNPNAQLAMGGLAYDWFDPVTAPTPWYPNDGTGRFNYNFLSEVLAYMKANPLPSGQRYMDLVLFNYFDWFGTIWQKVAAGNGIQAKAAQLQARMAAFGASYPLLVTETGEDSQTWGLQPQANCLTITMVRGVAVGLQGVIWWTLRDGPNWGTSGLTDESLTPKLSYSALQTLNRELNGYTFSATKTDTTGFSHVEAYEFKRDGSTKTVVWSSVTSTSISAQCASARLTKMAVFGPNVGYARISDVTGAVSIIKDNNAGDQDSRAGYIGINAKDRPLFVQTLLP